MSDHTTTGTGAAATATPGRRPRRRRTNRHVPASVPVIHPCTTTGTLRVHPRGFGFVDTDGDSVHVPASLLVDVLDGDVVEVVHHAAPRPRAIGIRVLERTRPVVFGIVERDGDGRRRLRLDPGLGALRIALPNDAPLGHAAVVRLGADGAEIEEVFADPTAVEAVAARVLIRHRLPRHPVPAPRGRGRGRRSGTAARRDLRDLVTLTIDADSSMDLDDALSVLPADPDGGLRVLVHIADVAEHVRPGTRTDVAARAVATSVYLPGFTRHMLPERLSQSALSLLPGVERDALTVEMRIDPAGEITSVDISESRIRSNARLSYSTAARLLRNEPVDDLDAAVVDALAWLRTASARLALQHSRRGGIAARRIEPELARTSSERDQIAHDLIERLMVATNEAVGRWLRERGLPAIWRVHDAPGPEVAVALEAFAASLGFHAGFGPELSPLALAALDTQLQTATDGRTMALWDLMLTHSTSARYQAEPALHFGLGSPAYLHFTSPIRRYVDLVVHRFVKAYLHGERTPQRWGAVEDLVALGEHLTRQAQAAKRAENDATKILAAIELSRSRDMTRPLTGRVVAITERGVRVALEGWPLTGFLAFGRRAAPWKIDHTRARSGRTSLVVGQRLKVRVAAVDTATGDVELR